MRLNSVRDNGSTAQERCISTHDLSSLAADTIVMCDIIMVRMGEAVIWFIFHRAFLIYSLIAFLAKDSILLFWGISVLFLLFREHILWLLACCLPVSTVWQWSPLWDKSRGQRSWPLLPPHFAHRWWADGKNLLPVQEMVRWYQAQKL